MASNPEHAVQRRRERGRIAATPEPPAGLARNASLYTAAERAALRWTETLTKLAGNHVTDDDLAEMTAHFNEAETSRITLAIATINAWNRFGTAFRLTVAAA